MKERKPKNSNEGKTGKTELTIWLRRLRIGQDGNVLHTEECLNTQGTRLHQDNMTMTLKCIK